MVDQSAPMETIEPPAVGTAPVPPTSPPPEPPQAPVPPPPKIAPIDETLRWLSTVATMAGYPDEIEISTTTRQINIAAPNYHLFTRWQNILGAVTQPTIRDALGATISATTTHPDLWDVTVHAHVKTTS